MRVKKNSNENFWKCIVVAAILLSGFFLINCGKKGDPVCPGVVKPAGITDLAAAVTKGEVELSWTIAADRTEKFSFKLFKSEIETQEADCPGCPRRYALMAELSSQDPRLRWKGERAVTYRDSNVRRGYLYSYTVLVCGSPDVCSDESNKAEVKVP